jgi:protein-tyrosine-phosphatase
MRRLAAELFGTFALVFAGTGAIIINDVSGGTVTHVGIALTFGLVVLAMIYAVGDVSGAHLNPAVSLGFVVARRFSARLVILYIVCQCAGAVLASSLLRALFPSHPTLGATIPAGVATQSFVLEARTYVALDVCHPVRFDGGEGEVAADGGGGRGGHRLRGDVRRTDLRSVDEPGPVAGPCPGVRAGAIPLGVPDAPGSGRGTGRIDLPVRPGAPVLLCRGAEPMKRVVFVCMENANRSQMAEAFARMHGGGKVEACSAGSRPSGRVNPKAVQAMKELGYDLTNHQSKGLKDFDGQEFDVAVTMGCGDECPFIRAKRRVDWDIPDPKDLPPDQFRAVRDLIGEKVKELIAGA